MKRAKRKKSNKDIVLVFDENLEGVSSSDILEYSKESNVETTSVKGLGLGGKSDSQIAQELSTTGIDAMIFVTTDKEKKKQSPDFFPQKDRGIIRFGSNKTTKEQKVNLLNAISNLAGFKKLVSFLGKEVKITPKKIFWSTFKNPTYVHEKKWNKVTHKKGKSKRRKKTT